MMIFFYIYAAKEFYQVKTLIIGASDMDATHSQVFLSDLCSQDLVLCVQTVMPHTVAFSKFGSFPCMSFLFIKTQSLVWEADCYNSFY